MGDENRVIGDGNIKTKQPFKFRESFESLNKTLKCVDVDFQNV